MVCVLVLLCGIFVGFSVSHAEEPSAIKKCRFYNTALTTLFDESSIDIRSGESPEQNHHVAALGFGKYKSVTWELTWACGGSLISENYVLTAAHCLKSNSGGPLQFVRLGSTHLSYDGLGEIVEVEKTITHPDYKLQSHYNDIGLIKLRRSVIFSRSILPACLNTIENFTHVAPQSTELETVGWGREDLGGQVPDDLWKAQVQYSTNEKCQKAYKNVSARVLPSGIDFSNQFCAYKAMNNAKPCHLLSGSPIQAKHEGIGLSTLLGVTSFGIGCENEETPGVYTRVSAYVPWIESIVWK